MPASEHSSKSSFYHSQRGPTAVKTVVTSPPWARDEPPSPTENDADQETQNWLSSRPSDVTSFQSSSGGPSGSRWWAFTLPRQRDQLPTTDPADSPPPSTYREKRGVSLKERSISWIPSRRWSQDIGFMRREKEGGPETIKEEPSSSGAGLHIVMPPQPEAPFTLSHSRTPGWDSPWTPRLPPRNGGYTDIEVSNGLYNQDSDDGRHIGPWQKRKKRLRTFMLTNTYVPLLFRFINITFTTAALGVAIKIRQWEMRNNLMGAVGSSPTLVIIFAPLTLLHVMWAIYLEYFGRPLGLWRTSGKLAHTLSEVLFICAWSAALSLCFDNFFTSLIPCAPSSDISWYNNISRPSSPFNAQSFEGGIGDKICDYQLALICLVCVGLIMYCTNLIISLYRIFEKVKYHPPSSLRR